MLSFSRLTRSAFDYRVHLYVLFFLLALSQSFFSELLLLVSLSFTSLIISIYLFNKTTDITEDALNDKAGDLSSKSREILLVALFFLIVPAVYIASLNDLLLMCSFVAVACNGFFYSYPIGVSGFRLKKIFLVKNISATVTLVLPLVAMFIYFNGVWDLNILWSVFQRTLIIIFSTEILWDMRDMVGDRAAKILTIPLLVGEVWAKSVVVFLISLIFITQETLSARDFILNTGVFLSALIMVFANHRRPWWYFHLIIALWLFIFLYLHGSYLLGTN